MNKIYQVIELYSSNKLSEANALFEEILHDKIISALQERKEEIDLFSEGGNPENKKKKNRLEFRLGRLSGAVLAKHEGRKLRRTDPNQMKLAFATEGTTKGENKRHKGEVEERIGASLRKNHFGMSLGGSKKSEGRQALKTLPSSVTKVHSKKGITPHWTSQIGFYRTPVTESNGDWVSSARKHLVTSHPHQAQQRNLRNVILKYKKIDAASRTKRKKLP